ncbi:PLAC8-domain-containing protein [Exidia glandulosa HHB12029]|uniref:PLAC8-domain-containing protein n=1 Tax=Exidia glandulosa HHB12029 TaxID=1314781 RepID=A0A165FWU8_EXIGL|nr:PLAC8-domain-containing protein [Exidia glandulosa HHB12029]
MNRNPKGLSHNSDGKRDWSEGLCGCFGDCGTCCVATFLPCMTYSKNKSRREYLNSHGRPHPEGGDGCGGGCFLYGCLTVFTGLGWLLSVPERNATRERYSIKGSGCGSCLTVMCCLPCALTQESREIELEEQSLQK